MRRHHNRTRIWPCAEVDGNARYWLSWRSTENEEHGANTTVFTEVDDVAVRIVIDVSLRLIWSLGIEGSEFVVLHSFVASFARGMEHSLKRASLSL
jgi:hypothetical protein